MSGKLDRKSSAESTDLTEAELLRALVVLQAAERDGLAITDKGGRGERSEVILARAGFSASQIAAMTGRGYEAVRGTIRRNREPKGKTNAENS